MNNFFDEPFKAKCKGVICGAGGGHADGDGARRCVQRRSAGHGRKEYTQAQEAE